MSLFRTLDRTPCTTPVSRPGGRPTQLLALLCPTLFTTAPHRSFSRSAVNRSPRLSASTFPSPSMDSFFIHALARAASCPEHAKQISTLHTIVPFSFSHHRMRRKSPSLPARRECREFKIKAERRAPFKKLRQFAKEELRALVDYYGIHVESPVAEVEDDSPLVWNVGDDHEPWPVQDPRDQTTIDTLEAQLRDIKTPHGDVFDTYKLLPSPGVVYLCTSTIRALLHHLSVVERPTRTSMQRFLSILDDMKKSHIHIIRSEWTSAIYLAGRFTSSVSVDDLQTALSLWRDMEKRAGIKGGVVTMNVLFDMAVKAGKYILAESFLREMQARRLRFHRHFRVSLLYYYGVLHDGNGVRKTYQDMIDAGDIVDTVVMNAVIASLIRAGEPGAAEHVFERMKRLHATRSARAPKNRPFSNRNWRERRILGLNLTYEALVLTQASDLDKRKELQDHAPISPDSRTYGLLIRHHATTAGNIDRVYELLQEMRHNSVARDGTIFIVIFQGFHYFGGVRYSSWTSDKLEKTWDEFLKAVENNEERTWISSTAIIAALKAFKKCFDAKRTEQVWEQVRPLWDPSSEELELVLSALRRLVPPVSQNPFFDEYGGV